MTTPCVFCDLMTSGEARWVARHEDAVAFLPLADALLAPGHTLVVPRTHCVGVLDAPRTPGTPRPLSCNRSPAP